MNVKGVTRIFVVCFVMVGVKASSGGAEEYWIPYVDPILGSSATYSQIVIHTAFRTGVDVDFSGDGTIDKTYLRQSGEEKSVAVPRSAGKVPLRSTKPISVLYDYLIGNYGAYEDGWYQYCVPSTP